MASSSGSAVQIGANVRPSDDSEIAPPFDIVATDDWGAIRLDRDAFGQGSKFRLGMTRDKRLKGFRRAMALLLPRGQQRQQDRRQVISQHFRTDQSSQLLIGPGAIGSAVIYAVRLRRAATGGGEESADPPAAHPEGT